MTGEQRPGWFFAHVQDDLNLHILHMYKGTFSLDAAHYVFVVNLRIWVLLLWSHDLVLFNLIRVPSSKYLQHFCFFFSPGYTSSTYSRLIGDSKPDGDGWAPDVSSAVDSRFIEDSRPDGDGWAPDVSSAVDSRLLGDSRPDGDGWAPDVSSAELSCVSALFWTLILWSKNPRLSTNLRWSFPKASGPFRESSLRSFAPAKENIFFWTNCLDHRSSTSNRHILQSWYSHSS